MKGTQVHVNKMRSRPSSAEYLMAFTCIPRFPSAAIWAAFITYMMSACLSKADDIHMIPGLGRRVLTTEYMENIEGVASQPSQEDVNIRSPPDTSLKMYEVMLLVLACSIFVASFIAALICLVYVCTPSTERTDSPVPKSAERCEHPCAVSSLRLYDDPQNSAWDHFTSVFTPPPRIAPAAVAPRAKTDEFNTLAARGKPRPISGSSASTRIPASISETHCTTLMNTGFSSCNDAYRTEIERESDQIFSAAQCSTVEHSQVPYAVLEETKRPLWTLDMTPAQCRMFQGINEFVNSEFVHSDVSMLREKIANSIRDDMSQSQAYTSVRYPMQSNSGSSNVCRGVEYWRNKLYKGGNYVVTPSSTSKVQRFEHLTTREGANHDPFITNYSTRSSIEYQRSHVHGRSECTSSSATFTSASRTIRRSASSEGRWRCNLIFDRLPSPLTRSAVSTPQCQSVLSTGTPATSAALNGGDAFMMDSCPLDHIDLAQQIELLRLIESMPAYGSIGDTPTDTQQDTMGDALTALLDSLGTKYSSQGSIPTESISLQLMRNGGEKTPTKLRPDISVHSPPAGPGSQVSKPESLAEHSCPEEDCAIDILPNTRIVVSGRTACALPKPIESRAESDSVSVTTGEHDYEVRPAAKDSGKSAFERLPSSCPEVAEVATFVATSASIMCKVPNFPVQSDSASDCSTFLPSIPATLPQSRRPPSRLLATNP